jgi:outer membrane lipoprotein-sorting protein
LTRSPARAWLAIPIVPLALLFVLGSAAAPAAETTWTARELLRRAQQSYQEINDYQCEVTLFTRKGQRQQDARLEFAFKKPGMVRARVIAGSHRGSEVVVRRDGKIRGHQGGILSAIKVTLGRDDRRLYNIRGEPVWDADWGAFLRKFQAALEQRPVEAVVHPGEAGTLVADLRLTGTPQPDRQVYIVDASSFLLRGAERYEGDTLVTRITYAKERLNPNLPDGYFNM